VVNFSKFFLRQLGFVRIGFCWRNDSRRDAGKALEPETQKLNPVKHIGPNSVIVIDFAPKLEPHTVDIDFE
jgi:hypothetical protein